jgi:hypothetical protein
VPAALLVAVALHQRRRMHTHDQNAWKGGGFGMFSDIHTGSVTALLSTADAAGVARDLFLELPAGARPSIVPTERNLRSWADEIITSRWTDHGGRAVLDREGDANKSLTVRRVIVRFARLDFDRRTGTHRASVHKKISVPASDKEGEAW